MISSGQVNGNDFPEEGTRLLPWSESGSLIAGNCKRAFQLDGSAIHPYMISSRRMWLLILWRNKEPQAHNGSRHGGRTIKLQPVRGLPAEPKQISQTSDSSTGQTTCTCCVTPVILVYFYLVSVTPLCSIINTQCTGRDRLKDVINSFLAFLYLLCISWPRPLHPFFLLSGKMFFSVTWSSYYFSTLFHSLLAVAIQLELVFTVHCARHFEGFVSFSSHNCLVEVFPILWMGLKVVK